MALVTDYDRERRWRRTFLLRWSTRKSRRAWSQNVRSGIVIVIRNSLMPPCPMANQLCGRAGSPSFWHSSGASAGLAIIRFWTGFDLETFKAERLFQSDNRSFESVVRKNARSASRMAVECALSPNMKLRCAAQLFAAHGQVFAKTNGTHATDTLSRSRRNCARSANDWSLTNGLTACRCHSPSPSAAGLSTRPKAPDLVWAYPLEYARRGHGRASFRSITSSPLIGGVICSSCFRGYAVLDGAICPSWVRQRR